MPIPTLMFLKVRLLILHLINIIKFNQLSFETVQVLTRALIITAGTFLNGLIHIGNHSFAAGRMGEKPSIGLTQSLEKYGLNQVGLKQVHHQGY